jgi:ligand-binding sensor domain-containing protein
MNYKKLLGCVLYLLTFKRIIKDLDKMKKNTFLVSHFPICAVILVALVSMDIAPNSTELVWLPETLVKIQDSAGNSMQVSYSNETGIPLKSFSAVIVDDDNIKWFITEAGIVSFNGEEWKLHNENKKVPTQNLKDIAFEHSSQGPELWITSPNGVTVASLPIDGRTGATTYQTENTSILSNNVVRVAIGKSLLRGFGTDKGVSAFRNSKWLSPSYDEIYPESMFGEFAITSMATNRTGDSLYVGTEGAGIARVYRNIDGISGASSYAQWGPIILPSDKIYSIFVAYDGTQWFGTDQGIARHTGNKTLENWTTFTTGDGLVNNFVQAIAADNSGILWFGTKGGVSVFDGSVWTSFTINDGLISNNVLCIAVDHDGVVWLGTDNGVTCYKNRNFISYKLY